MRLCADTFFWFAIAEETAPKSPAGIDGYATRAGLELGGWLFLGGTVQVRFCGDCKGCEGGADGVASGIGTGGGGGFGGGGRFGFVGIVVTFAVSAISAIIDVHISVQLRNST